MAKTNKYRITYVNPASSPHPSYECIQASNATEAVRAFWQRINPASVVGKRIHAIERQVTTVSVESPNGSPQWWDVEWELSQ